MFSGKYVECAINLTADKLLMKYVNDTGLTDFHVFNNQN